MRTVLVVAAALISVESASPRVLLAQRPAGKKMAGLWEFPGGKVEVGETPEAALSRELREELGIDLAPASLKPLTFASHTYADEGFHLLMPVYTCVDAWAGDPSGAEGQRLAWATAPELESYEMPAADLPLLGAVRRALSDSAAPNWQNWN